jgi:hypothetical protein
MSLVPVDVTAAAGTAGRETAAIAAAAKAMLPIFFDLRCFMGLSRLGFPGRHRHLMRTHPRATGNQPHSGNLRQFTLHGVD